MDGVIVIRPITSWNDPAHPLSRAATVRLKDVTLSQVIDVEQALLDPGIHHGGSSDPRLDARRLSVDVAHGTQIDVLNAAVRSYGMLSWSYEVLDEHDIAVHDGRGQMIGFHVAGAGGKGFAFP